MKSLTIKDYYNDFISRTQSYKNISFEEYKRLICRHYIEVMNEVVKGNGVRFTNGLGILLIEYEDMSLVKKHNVIDWPATQRKKKELLAKGIKIYDKQEAEDYTKAGITYDGVECIIYKDTDYKIRAMVIKSDIIGSHDVCIVPTNTLPPETKGLTHKEIAEQFSDEVLGALKYNFRARAEINILRNKLNYLKYKHKMI